MKMRRTHFWAFGGQKTAICLTLAGLTAFGAQAQLGTPPRIDVQPLGLAVTEGGIATFTVTVSLSTVLTSPTFKWRRNGEEIGGGLTLAAVNTLVINDVRSADAGTYTVEVRNAAGTVVSSNAVLLILAQPVVDTVKVVASGMTANGFQLRVEGATGSNYVVQASTDLAKWTSIATNSAPTGIMDYTDTEARNHPQRFYRVLVQ